MTKPKMIYPEGVEQNDEGTTHYPPPRLEQLKSECKCIDCNLPELESDCKPEQPKTNKLPNCKNCGNRRRVTVPCPKCVEQPNTELLIVKTIQSLTTCINNELEKLVVLRGCMPINNMMVVIDQAIEDINSFENITLELQKAFE